MTDFKHIALVANIQLPEIIDSLKQMIELEDLVLVSWEGYLATKEPYEQFS